MCAGCGRCAGAADRDIMQGDPVRRDAIRTARGAMKDGAGRGAAGPALHRVHVPGVLRRGTHPGRGHRKNGGTLQRRPYRLVSTPIPEYRATFLQTFEATEAIA